MYTAWWLSVPQWNVVIMAVKLSMGTRANLQYSQAPPFFTLNSGATCAICGAAQGSTNSVFSVTVHRARARIKR
jgi:hypothetical protein